MSTVWTASVSFGQASASRIRAACSAGSTLSDHRIFTAAHAVM
jgi:hypothetical protein